MVNTRSSTTPQDSSTDQRVADPLAAIAARLESLDVLAEKVSALEAAANRRKKGKSTAPWEGDTDDERDNSYRPRPPIAKLEFPRFSGGDPRGWLLKADKFFRYYGTPEDDKVEVAALYLEGDALDLFS